MARLKLKVLNFAFNDRKLGNIRKYVLYCLPIELAVGLRPGTSNRRPLAPVEHSELNPGCISRSTHQAIEGINLADKVTLAQATDRRITRHRPNRGEPMRH